MRLFRRLFFGFVLWRLFGPVLSPRFRSPQEHPWRHVGHTVFVGDQEFLVRDLGPDERSGAAAHPWARRLVTRRVVPDRPGTRREVPGDHGRPPKSWARPSGPGSLRRRRHRRRHGRGPRCVSASGWSRSSATRWGAPLPSRLPIDYPARVDRLVLIATFTHHPRAGADPPGGRSGDRQGLGTAHRSRARRRFDPVICWPPVPSRNGTLVGSGRRPIAGHRRRSPGHSCAAALRLPTLDREDRGRDHGLDPHQDQLVPPAWQYQLASGTQQPHRSWSLVGVRHEAPVDPLTSDSSTRSRGSSGESAASVTG